MNSFNFIVSSTSTCGEKSDNNFIGLLIKDKNLEWTFYLDVTIGKIESKIYNAYAERNINNIKSKIIYDNIYIY
ncbi:hypothetical protein [Spiroplasma endosymbiont of Virgichneumon dumeticola]|uniref:hypothetical protein n=1 Tax=Spiroplasma endosymbiont of Virgichneumon dumeticola TaxID=3139323 RepID=UPI0035C91281